MKRCAIFLLLPLLLGCGSSSSVPAPTPPNTSRPVSPPAHPSGAEASKPARPLEVQLNSPQSDPSVPAPAATSPATTAPKSANGAPNPGAIPGAGGGGSGAHNPGAGFDH